MKAAPSATRIYVTTAPSPAIIIAMPWTARFGARKAAVAFTGLRATAQKRNDLLTTTELVETSVLVPVIDTTYPLGQIAQAHARVDAGHKQGNVIVTMTEP